MVPLLVRDNPIDVNATGRGGIKGGGKEGDSSVASPPFSLVRHYDDRIECVETGECRFLAAGS